MSDHQEYWFCVKHHRVETADNLCPNRHRLGPYASAAEAERALDTTEERNAAWDNDPKWNDDDDDDGPDAPGDAAGRGV
ncbi:hypothetical protein [Nocardioides marmotae]|uniref:hypothetical protein n=1 Tax=Nocardioides marmotae TaxID=2663857 RepID=UPI0012B5BF07|nr:hypothetical protein [Nocardioides marmotae]MBC9735261.1 hypothetical protein [Nocardioides marmotae]MTB86361.1 hypothetical protein [Nocardioides marmotae]